MIYEENTLRIDLYTVSATDYAVLLLRCAILAQWKLPAIYRSNLVKSPLNGDTEPEPAICCNQTKHPVVGLGHQPCHKTFHLRFVLST